MRDLVIPVVVALIVGPLAAGLTPLVQAWRGRGLARADSAKIISDTAIGLVGPVREELDQVRREARALADELYRLRAAVFAPDATIDGLREMLRRGSADRS